MDFHLINIICAELTLPFHYNPLPFHPFVSSVQLDIADIHTATTGVFIHIYDIPFFLGEQIDTLILAGIRICLITSQEGLPVQHSETPIIIQPDTLMVHTSGTWRGDTRPSPETRNYDNLYCHHWNLTPSEVSLLHDSIRGRTLGGEKWELQQPIHKYCPETNTPLWGYAEGSHPSRRQTTAFWGGGVDETVMRALPVPPFTLRKC